LAQSYQPSGATCSTLLQHNLKSLNFFETARFYIPEQKKLQTKTKVFFI